MTDALDQLSLDHRNWLSGVRVKKTFFLFADDDSSKIVLASDGREVSRPRAYVIKQYRGKLPHYF